VAGRKGEVGVTEGAYVLLYPGGRKVLECSAVTLSAGRLVTMGPTSGTNTFTLRGTTWSSPGNEQIPPCSLEIQPDGDLAWSNGFISRPATAHMGRLRAHALEAVEPTGNMFLDKEGALMEGLRSGALRLVRGAYFERQWAAQEPWTLRQLVPEQFFWSPEEAVRMWRRYHSLFFFSVSYAWLSREHPDPEMYHLEV